MQQGHRHIASNRALGGELLFSYVKSHLPEVTIKTHLSAQANVFIPDFTLESLHLLICCFIAVIKVQGAPANVVPRLR